MMSACSLHCGSMFVLNYVDPVMVTDKRMFHFTLVARKIR